MLNALWQVGVLLALVDHAVAVGIHDLDLVVGRDLGDIDGVSKMHRPAGEVDLGVVIDGEISQRVSGRATDLKSQHQDRDQRRERDEPTARSETIPRANLPGLVTPMAHPKIHLHPISGGPSIA